MTPIAALTPAELLKENERLSQAVADYHKLTTRLRTRKAELLGALRLVETLAHEHECAGWDCSECGMLEVHAAIQKEGKL